MRPLLKYTLSLFSFLLIAFGSNAQTPLIQQLTSVNAHWQDYTEVTNELKKPYKNLQHEEKIKLHLEYIEKILRERNTEHLSSNQRANRNKSLDVLNQYYREGAFPQNTNHPNEIIPYFIDKYNTACAVGHLIRESGNTLLPNKIHTENNYGYIKELIKIYPEIKSWATANGFTIDELAWIQPTYGPCKYEHKFPVVFGDSTFIQASRCTQAGYNGCSNPYENGYFILDSNGYPGLTPPLSGTFYLQGFNPFGGVTYWYQNPPSFKGGTYYVTINDANNNTALDTITIPTLPNDITYNIQSVNLSHGAPGRISVTNLSGGTGQYRVTISKINYAPNSFVYSSNLQTGDSLAMDSIIFGGKYSIVIQDKNSRCELGDSVHLPGSLGLLDSLSAPIVLDSVRCLNDTGIAIYTAYNTTTNYQITDTFSFSVGGTTISFKDSSNQTSYFGIYHYYAQNTFTPIITVTQPLCHNDSGIVTISAPSAPQPVTNTGTFTRAPGYYNQTLVSADGCSRNITYNIQAQNSKINLASDSVLYKCPGASSPNTPTFTGGTSPYVYSFSPVGVGQQKILVYDSLNCTDSFQVQIIHDTVWASAIVTQPSCFGTNGTVTIHATNSLNTYSFTNTIANAPGNYIHIVADSLGCKDTVQYTVNNPTNSKIVVSSPTTLIKCKNVPYNFTPSFAGGAPPYSFSPNNLSLGTQQVYITDNANCTDSALFHLQESDIDINIVMTDSIKCHGELGECEIVGIGSHTPFTGVGKISYTADSVYNFTISDNAGCSTSIEKTFSQPEEIYLTNEKNSLDLFMKGIYTAEVNGGTPPYKYQLEGFTNTNVWEEALADKINIDMLNIGSYELHIKDANDCRFDKTFIIGESINTTKLISIFPNPFSNRIFVLLNDTYRDVDIRIFNTNGQSLYSKHFVELKQQDILLTLSGGVYFLEINAPSLSKQIFKIMRE